MGALPRPMTYMGLASAILAHARMALSSAGVCARWSADQGQSLLHAFLMCHERHIDWPWVVFSAASFSILAPSFLALSKEQNAMFGCGLSMRVLARPLVPSRGSSDHWALVPMELVVQLVGNVLAVAELTVQKHGGTAARSVWSCMALLVDLDLVGFSLLGRSSET